MINLSNVERSLDSVFSETFSGKRVLITGHTGFKGSWLSIWLNKLGAKVSGLSLDPSSIPSNFIASGVSQLLTHDIRTDVRNYSDVLAAIEFVQPEIIFHLAAQPIVAVGVSNPFETFETNIMGTTTLLEALRTLGKPCVVVVVTSDKCYRESDGMHAFSEADALGGSEPYGGSKAGAEIVVNAYRESYFTEGVPRYVPVQIASARAGNVVGGGDWSPFRIVPDIVRSLLEGRPILLRSPNAVRPWQHVLEPLRGYLRLAEKLISAPDRVSFATSWNFGPTTKEVVSVRNLVETAIEVWGSGSWDSVNNEFSKHERELLYLDIGKSQRELGWSPKWEFAETIEKTIRWYRDLGTNYLEGDARWLCDRDLDDYGI